MARKKSRRRLLDFFFYDGQAHSRGVFEERVDRRLNFEYEDNRFPPIGGQSKGKALIVRVKKIENHEKGGDDEAY
jgi:hypothetical protein